MVVDCGIIANNSFKIGLIGGEGLFVLVLFDSLLQELGKSGIGARDRTAL